MMIILWAVLATCVLFDRYGRVSGLGFSESYRMGANIFRLEGAAFSNYRLLLGILHSLVYIRWPSGVRLGSFRRFFGRFA